MEYCVGRLEYSTVKVDGWYGAGERLECGAGRLEYGKSGRLQYGCRKPGVL